MKREAEVWKRFADRLPGGVFARRIEDASGALGTWDLVVMRGGRGGWIELKHTQRATQKPKLRKGQYAFGMALAASGTKGFYVVGSTDGAVRLIRQDWDGEDDWRDYVVEQWVSMSEEAVLDILRRIGIDDL